MKSLVDLFKWTKRFYSVNLIEIKEKLTHYQSKVVTLNCKTDIKAIVD